MNQDYDTKKLVEVNITEKIDQDPDLGVQHGYIFQKYFFKYFYGKTKDEILREDNDAFKSKLIKRF